MRVGTSITSCSKSYVGPQANNMDERTPDSKRIGECLTLKFLIMKDLKLSKLSLKKDYVSELSSREMQNVRGGRGFLSIRCTKRRSRKTKCCNSGRGVRLAPAKGFSPLKFAYCFRSVKHFR